MKCTHEHFYTIRGLRISKLQCALVITREISSALEEWHGLTKSIGENSLLSGLSAIRTKLVAYIELIHFDALQRWLAATTIGFFFFAENSTNAFNLSHFLEALLSIALILSYLMSINDCFDVDIDKEIESKMHIVSEVISFKHALLLSIVMLAFGLITAWFINNQFFVIALLLTSLSTLYSVPPVRYKQTYPYSTLGEIAGAFLPFLAGYAIIGSIEPRGLIVSAIFALVSTSGRFRHEAHYYKDDQKTGKMTIAVVHGADSAVFLSKLCVILAITESLLLTVLGWFSIAFLFLLGLYLFFALEIWRWFFHLSIRTFVALFWSFGFTSLAIVILLF